MLLDDLKDRYGRREQLKGFFDFAAQLPASLTYNHVPYATVSTTEMNTLRNAFNRDSFKRRMYRWFGETHGPQLLAMDVPNYEIDRMVIDGVRPKSRNGHRLDFTVDHITSRSFGGTNDMDNLCFLPGKLNHFKNVLEDLQLNDPHRKPHLVLTIKPRKSYGYRSAVPYIEGGYAERIDNAGINL